MKALVISVDFDGTLVEDKYPEIGEPYPKAIETIRKWADMGHKIIINTCRAGKPLGDVINYLRIKGIPYTTINENLPERVEKYGGDTRKISADVYIDDKSVFCTADNKSWDYYDMKIRLLSEEKEPLPEVCAYCRHWKIGLTSRSGAFEVLAYAECHVKQPQMTRADETCRMWKEAGKA